MLVGLRSQLVLRNLLISLLGLLIVVVVFTWLLAQRARDLKTQELAQQSGAVAAEIHATVYKHHGSLMDLRYRVLADSHLLGERILVASPTGTIVIDSAGSKDQSLVNPLALRNEKTVASLRSQALVLFQRPIRGTHGHNGGAVVLAAPAGDVTPHLASLLDFSLIAALTALLVWLLMAVYFTSSVFQPLLRITDATRRMAAGDYEARVHLPGDSEIARLATSFNSMAAQVQAGNQVLKDFVANVSHDLRTPLTVILGFSEALVDGTAEAADVHDTGAVIHDEAEKMQHLVDDLLQLTRLESGLFTLDMHPVPIRPFVQSAIDRIVYSNDPLHMPAIHNVIPSTAPLVLIDPNHMERVLRNLLDNAIRHTPPGGVIVVDAQPAGTGWLEISVADSGSGIAPDDLTRIFERFYRSDKSRERSHGSSGLGLAIVREIVEAHGGRVTATSEPNCGATFRFTVPRAPSTARERTASHLPEPADRTPVAR